MANLEFAGFLFDNAGTAIAGATVQLYEDNSTTASGTSVLTDSDGYWSISTSANEPLDVQITSGSSIRRLKYATAVQYRALEVADFRIRNPGNTYKYDIVPAAISADRTLTLPLITGPDTLASLGLAQTFSAAQTFTATVTMNAANAIVFEGATADAYETTMAIIDPTADRTVYMPNQSGYLPVLAVASTTQISATPAELNVLDGITAGTVTASLGLVVDSNKDIATLRNLTIDGVFTDGNYTFDTSGNVSGLGTVASGAITSSGIIKTDATTEATSTTDGSLQTDGGLSVVKDAVFGDDLSLLSDSAVFNMGAGNDFTITHDGTTGATLAGTPISINATGALTLDSSTDITLDADGGDVFFKDGGTTFGSATNTSGNLIIKSGTTTALTFSGANVTAAGNLTFAGATTVSTSSGDLTLYSHSAGDVIIGNGSPIMTVDGGTNSVGVNRAAQAATIMIVGGAPTSSVTRMVAIERGDTGSVTAPMTSFLVGDPIFTLTGALSGQSATVHLTGATFSGAYSADKYATLYIHKAATLASSATLPNGNYALWVKEDVSRFDGNVDLNSSGTLLNVGADGNDWTATALTHGGDLKVGNATSADSGTFRVTDSDPELLQLETTSAGGNGPLVRLYHNSSSPADNDQQSFVFSSNDSGGTRRSTHNIEFRFLDVTAGSTDSEITFLVMNNATGNNNITATLTSAGVWTDASAARDKTFEGTALAVWGGRDGFVATDKVRALSTGRYHSSHAPPAKLAKEQRHIGPTAEDFYAAFGCGPNPSTATPGIAAKDLAGAAILVLQEIIPRLDAVEDALNITRP